MRKANLHKIIIILIAMGLSVAYSSDIFHANLYLPDQPDQLVYTHTNTIEEKGDSVIIRHFYYTPDGEIYVEDKVILVNNEPYYNSFQFFQIGEFSSLERKGDKVELKHIKNGKEKSITRNLKLPLVFAPIQQMALRNYLEMLQNGETADFYIFASDITSLLKMKVVMVNDSDYERPGCIVLQMKPKSKLIDWFVDEVFYVVNKTDGKIMEMHGFSTLKIKVKNEWVYRDMDFYYSYE